MQQMLCPGPISTNTEEQLWQKNCHRLYLQHWIQQRGPWNFTQGSALDSPTSNRDSALTTACKVTTTAPDAEGNRGQSGYRFCPKLYLKQKMKTQGSQPVTLHADGMKRISPHLCLPFDRAGSKAEDSLLHQKYKAYHFSLEQIYI